MAIENVFNFLQALEQDEDLAVRADDAFVKALYNVASGAGYDISEDELRSALDGEAGDLSEGQLDDVVGGVTAVQTTTDPGAGQYITVPSTKPGTSQTLTTRFSSFSKSGFSR